MQAVDTVFVTRNEWAEKRFPQGGGVGVRRILGRRKEEQGLGTREYGLGLRGLKIGEWSFGPRVSDWFYSPRGKGNYLQTGAGRYEREDAEGGRFLVQLL